MVVRLVKWALILVAALVVIAVGAVAYPFYRAMPAYSGTEPLAGLGGEVRVYRDAHGVPHIFAADDERRRAGARLHPCERAALQMEIQRRVGQGRLAEIFGPDLVRVDKFIRTLGLYRLAASQLFRPRPDAQALCAGLCRRRQRVSLDAHAARLPPEFLILGDDAGALDAGRFAGLGQALELAAQPQLRARDDARRLAQKLPPDAGEAGSSRRRAGRLADHDAARRDIRARRIDRAAR